MLNCEDWDKYLKRNHNQPFLKGSVSGTVPGYSYSQLTQLFVNIIVLCVWIKFDYKRSIDN